MQRNKWQSIAMRHHLGTRGVLPWSLPGPLLFEKITNDLHIKVDGLVSLQMTKVAEVADSEESCQSIHQEFVELQKRSDK